MFGSRASLHMDFVAVNDQSQNPQSEGRRKAITSFSRLIVSVLMLVSTTSGMHTSNVTEQEAYHIWTSEPELTMAIACRDNDVGFERPEDPNRDRPVPLPSVVREAICDLTRRTFAKRLYEGHTPYADLFGPVYRLKVPDSDGLSLYVYQLKDLPTLAFRWYSIVLVLHDVKHDRISSTLAEASTDYQAYCPRPWIRFEDVIGDETKEILLLTGHHRGTGANHVLMHILSIGDDLGLHEVLSLRTGISMGISLSDDVEGDSISYAVRTIEKEDPNHCKTTVTLSKNKLVRGRQILGYETWELGENGYMRRIAQTVIVDEKHDYIFSEQM